MKKISFILLLLCFSFSAFSQKNYTLNGETYQLKTEIEGTIDLLWNTIDGKFRYFVRTKDGLIQELTNTKDSRGDYENEYKSFLNNLTNNTLDTSDLKFTLYRIKDFIHRYNASVDSKYAYTLEKLKVNSRLGFFGGLTNNPFVDNPNNKTTPLFGAELELYDDNKAKRHAAFLQLTHVLENDELNYSTTEIALGYRFKFINTDKFNLHANIKLVTLSFSNSTFTYEDQDTMEPITKDRSATSFDAPVIFGLGVDFKVSDNGFITFYYNELFAVSLENQGNFSTNFALGYKFNL